MVEVSTERGTERHPFTLDDDRALRPQVVQVLEELRQRGVVLKGNRDDELGAYWGGQQLDQSLRLSELGLSPSRPLELRMRVREAARPSATIDRSLPRGVLASLVLGYTGALAAWLISGVWTDTNSFVSSYLRLDQATVFLLGGLVGAAVLGGAALRTRGAALLAVAAGVVLGGAGALLGASAVLFIPGAETVRGFILARVAGWALAGGMTSLLLACYATRFDLRRLAESFVVGVLAGGMSGVVFALPGPSEFWQAMAFCVFGAGVGVGACGPALWRSAAIVEVWGKTRVPGILSLREWPVAEGGAIALDGMTVACPEGQAALYPPPGGVMVGGHKTEAPIFLSGAHGVAAGTTNYYVRTSQGDA
ncbi:MAG: hypothetical protein ABI637_00540 [Gemmatimonadota bacterium]